jgi:hypothetical protein
MRAMREVPATGRAGFARSHESGRRRVPKPAESTRATGMRGLAEADNVVAVADLIWNDPVNSAHW